MKKELNKKIILRSTLWVPMVMPILGILTGIGMLANGETEGFWMILGIAIMGLIYGIIFWLPALIICLITEALMINRSSNKKTIQAALVIEAIICAAIIAIILPGSFMDIPMVAIILAIMATQWIRWKWLRSKDRMYLNTTAPRGEELVDDLETYEL